jgi:CHAT domain-containing protein
MAGAARVVASLWDVDDEATHLLMERTYARLRESPDVSPAQALRDAASWLRTQAGAGGRPFSAPRYWAAFVAYGR